METKDLNLNTEKAYHILGKLRMFHCESHSSKNIDFVKKTSGHPGKKVT